MSCATGDADRMLCCIECPASQPLEVLITYSEQSAFLPCLFHAAGKLPTNWGALRQLTDMRVDSNALTGTVPPGLADISRLDLSNNQLLCGNRPSTAMNGTLLAQRTSIGLDCSMLGSREARLSGIRGVILGKLTSLLRMAVTASYNLLPGPVAATV